MEPTDLLTTAQAATVLGLSRRRVAQLIERGLLPAQKYGRDYLIRREDLARVQQRPGPGRPRKTPPN